MTAVAHPYRYANADPTCASHYLWPVLLREIKALELTHNHVFDLGYGNAATAAMLANLGYEVTGIDLSESGIPLAKSAYPSCRFEVKRLR